MFKLEGTSEKWRSAPEESMELIMPRPHNQLKRFVLRSYPVSPWPLFTTWQNWSTRPSHISWDSRCAGSFSGSWSRSPLSLDASNTCRAGLCIFWLATGSCLLYPVTFCKNVTTRLQQEVCQLLDLTVQSINSSKNVKLRMGLMSSLQAITDWTYSHLLLPYPPPLS